MKAIKNLNKFEDTLPYGSEIFGTYTPLIGWKSKHITERFNNVSQSNNLAEVLKDRFTGIADLVIGQECTIKPGKINSYTLIHQKSRFLSEISKVLLEQSEVLTEEGWHFLFERDICEESLIKVCGKITTEYRDELDKQAPKHANLSIFDSPLELKNYYTTILQEESKIAGALQFLYDGKKFDELNKIFYINPEIKNTQEIQETILKNINDPFLSFNPNNAGDLNSKVSLSPFGIVHLFRQYFFEFDTFLGSPVGHIWLPPNSSVEVIESSTRKTITERTFETVLESISKTENNTTDQDDLSEGVKEDNRNDMKLGATASAGASGLQGAVANTWSASASLNMDTSHQEAKENTHKRMRQQSLKLSSEIRQNFKSTFRTTTEFTDLNSKSYIIKSQEKADNVLNYELRRKMRQVGVQVQDVGSYLCWQTFVDEPGENLGLSNLIHIAQSTDTQLNTEPQKIPIPQPKSVTVQGSVTSWFESISKLITITIIPESGYKLKDISTDRPESLINTDGGIVFQEQIGGLRVRIDRKNDGSNGEPVIVDIIRIDGYEERGKSIPFTITYIIEPLPTLLDKVNSANDKIMEAYSTTSAKALQKDLVDTAKERIKFASKINTRPYEDLREEERIIIYRNLIGTLLGNFNEISLPEDATTSQRAEFTIDNNNKRHILSELINAIFDVDKMLYFVAPEWWKPRVRSFKQFTSEIGDISKAVNWQDTPERTDNYLITDESNPAKMGSSLGWLLQLDGDKLRNAFLNAPWVKATIPIRPGKEKAALLWLKNIEGALGLDNEYIPTSEDELQQLKTRYTKNNFTVEEALLFLCEKVADKHRLSVDGVPNDDSTVTPNPIEKVYEYGFNPLQGGFTAKGKPFDVFDQWIEVLPTDQIAAVKVEYSPITGMQI